MKNMYQFFYLQKKTTKKITRKRKTIFYDQNFKINVKDLWLKNKNQLLQKKKQLLLLVIGEQQNHRENKH